MGKSKNSATIQLALAMIQKAMDTVGKKRARSFLVSKANTIATVTVGTAIIMPVVRQVISQHKSLMSHKGIWAISKINNTFFEFIVNCYSNIMQSLGQNYKTFKACYFFFDIAYKYLIQLIMQYI